MAACACGVIATTPTTYPDSPGFFIHVGFLRALDDQPPLRLLRQSRKTIDNAKRTISAHRQPRGGGAEERCPMCSPSGLPSSEPSQRLTGCSIQHEQGGGAEAHKSILNARRTRTNRLPDRPPRAALSRARTHGSFPSSCLFRPRSCMAHFPGLKNPRDFLVPARSNVLDWGSRRPPSVQLLVPCPLLAKIEGECRDSQDAGRRTLSRSTIAPFPPSYVVCCMRQVLSTRFAYGKCSTGGNPAYLLPCSPRG